MNYEQQHLNKVLVESLLEQRDKELRWKKYRFFILIIIISLLIWAYVSAIKSVVDGKGHSDAKKNGYAALVRIDGAIMPDSDASAMNIIPSIVKAFADEDAKGVILLINSPGGTPVQSALIRERISSLRKEFPQRRVVAIGEDMLTSGAYMVATGAESIFVNASTITGSIGVVMRGFGFSEAAKKLGIERRVYTAGESKSQLDPFTVANPADIEKINSVLGEVHQHFIDLVKSGRGDRLSKNDLFTGDFWTGKRAIELGLVDGIGDLASILRSEFSVKHYVEYGGEPDFLSQIKNLVIQTAVKGFNIFEQSNSEILAI